MGDEIIAIVVMGSFFGSISFITKVLSDNRVKRELISMKADTEVIDYLMLQKPADTYEGSLKWGIVCLALGAALAIIQVLGLSGDDPLTYGLLFIFGGAGLVGHYVLAAGRAEQT